MFEVKPIRLGIRKFRLSSLVLVFAPRALLVPISFSQSQPLFQRLVTLGKASNDRVSREKNETLNPKFADPNPHSPESQIPKS